MRGGENERKRERENERGRARESESEREGICERNPCICRLQIAVPSHSLILNHCPPIQVPNRTISSLLFIYHTGRIEKKLTGLRKNLTKNEEEREDEGKKKGRGVYVFVKGAGGETVAEGFRLISNRSRSRSSRRPAVSHKSGQSGHTRPEAKVISIRHNVIMLSNGLQRQAKRRALSSRRGALSTCS